ncbi:MAG: ThuA domain-containing protein [Promethearchaeota archaeon]
MGKTALCTYGGWEGHTPALSTGIMAEILEEEGFEVEFLSGLKCLEDYPKLENYDIIVFCHTMSEITKEQERNLVNAVMSGVGLVGWHGGLNDAFRSNVEYNFMTGGTWVSHPGGAGTTFEVNFVPEKKDDPIIRGLEDFKITTEQYYMHVDPGVEVLATTTFHSLAMPWINGVKMPVTYKKRWGDGKVFYTSIGHTSKDFEVPQALEMMKRGMLWAAELEELDFDPLASRDTLSGAF